MRHIKTGNCELAIAAVIGAAGRPIHRRKRSRRLSSVGIIVAAALVASLPACVHTQTAGQPGIYDGTYVPQPDMQAITETGRTGCPSMANEFGLGLIVKNSVATLDVGAQPQNAPILFPRTKFSAAVDARGNFDVTERYGRFWGQIHGPTQSGTLGEASLDLDVHDILCSYNIRVIKRG